MITPPRRITDPALRVVIDDLYARLNKLAMEGAPEPPIITSAQVEAYGSGPYSLNRLAVSMVPPPGVYPELYYLRVIYPDERWTTHSDPDGDFSIYGIAPVSSLILRASLYVPGRGRSPWSSDYPIYTGGQKSDVPTPTGLAIDPNYFHMRIKVDPVNLLDYPNFGGFEFYASQVEDFTPSDDTLIYKGNATRCVLYAGGLGQTWYVQARAYDTEGNYSSFCEQAFCTSSSVLLPFVTSESSLTTDGMLGYIEPTTSTIDDMDALGTSPNHWEGTASVSLSTLHMSGSYSIKATASSASSCTLQRNYGSGGTMNWSSYTHILFWLYAERFQETPGEGYSLTGNWSFDFGETGFTQHQFTFTLSEAVLGTWVAFAIDISALSSSGRDAVRYIRIQCDTAPPIGAAFYVDGIRGVTTNPFLKLRALASNKVIYPKIACGTYSGNNADNRQITVGWQPTAVHIQGKDVITPMLDVWKTSDMTSEECFLGDGTLVGANAIQSFNSTGFVIGNHANVNTGGTSYYWTALLED
jgi:hypothetical protein